MTPYSEIEVLIVCRAELLLLGLERLLSRNDDLRVLTYSRLPGRAVLARGHSRARATALPRRQAPRVALICARQAPDLTGDLERALESFADDAVVVSSGPDVSLLLAAMRVGARCFVMEGDPPEVLLAAIRAAARGDAYMGPRTGQTLVEWLGHRERAGNGSRREADRDMLRLLAEGRTTIDIAKRLGIAPKTVRNRLSKLYRALGVHSRGAAVRLAEDRGLLDPTDRGPFESYPG